MSALSVKFAILAGILILAAVASPVGQTAMAADLPLRSPVYPLLDRLWAEGRIDGYWPDALPVPVEQVREFAAGQTDVLSLLPRQSGTDLRPFVGLEDGTECFVGAGGGGLGNAGGAAAGLRASAEGPMLSAYGHYRLAWDGCDRQFPELYGQVRLGGLSLAAGRQSLWWGPGRRGALLLTDNAPAPDGLFFRTWPGFHLPWVLRHLGETRVQFFLSRLTGSRQPDAVAEPLFGGLRMSLSPHRNLIVSLARTFLYGGRGRDEGLGALLDALLARDGSEGDPNVIGNQIASLSAMWRLPSPNRPLLLYAEAAGEDEANYQPSKWGFLAGVYFPRLGAGRLLDLRLEAASTDMPGHESVWYRHSDYPYVFDGRIMGHPMGNDAHDFCLEVGLYPRTRSRVSIALTRTLRGVSSPDGQVMTGIALQGRWWRGNSSFGISYIGEDWDDPPEYAEDGHRLSITYEVGI